MKFEWCARFGTVFLRSDFKSTRQGAIQKENICVFKQRKMLFSVLDYFQPHANALMNSSFVGEQGPHGFGKRIWRNGDEYVGDAALRGSDLAVEGTFKTAATGCEVKGTFINFQLVLEQQAVELLPNGDIYEGTFDAELLHHGHGTQLYISRGAKYQGTWHHGIREGLATLTYANGDTYTGNFLDGQMTGNGVYTMMAAGAKYTGLFLNGLFEGNGTYEYSDNARFVGMWKEGKKQGYGELYSPPLMTGRGRWDLDELKSGGFHLDNNQSYYEGSFKNDKFDGFGTLEKFYLSRYEGFWKAGLYNGRGKLILRNGTVQEGIWIDGVLSDKKWNQAPHLSSLADYNSNCNAEPCKNLDDDTCGGKAAIDPVSMDCIEPKYCWRDDHTGRCYDVKSLLAWHKMRPEAEKTPDYAADMPNALLRKLARGEAAQGR